MPFAQSNFTSLLILIAYCLHIHISAFVIYLYMKIFILVPNLKMTVAWSKRSSTLSAFTFITKSMFWSQKGEEDES